MTIFSSSTRFGQRLFLSCVMLILAAGCVEPRAKVEQKIIPFTILLMDRLGVGRSDKIPGEIQSLLMPIHVEACNNVAFVPEAQFIRLDLEQPAELVIQPVADWVQGFQRFYKAQTIEIIENRARTELANTTLGDDFTEVGLSVDVTPAALSEYVHTHDDEQFMFHTKERNVTDIEVGSRNFPAYNDLKSLKSHLSETLCETSRDEPAKYSIVYNYRKPKKEVHVLMTKVDEMGHAENSETLPQAAASADEEFRKFVEWREKGSVRPEDLMNCSSSCV